MKKKIDFRISAVALDFLKQTVFYDPSQDLVLSIAPTTVAEELQLVEGSIEQTVAKFVETKFDSLDINNLEFKWTVGGSRRSRFSSEDIVTCSGIPCFIPSEMEEILDGHVLTVVNNELKIEPELSAPT